MRLFVAVEPPEVVVEELEDLVARLRQEADAAARAPGPGALRWARRGQWHVTLTFLGEVPDVRLAELTERLRRAGSRRPQLGLQLSGGGRFGHRTLFAGLQGDREPLRLLAGATGSAARRAGVAVERRPYRPHLTLARTRGPVDLAPWVGRLAGWSSSPWQVGSIALVRSHLGPTVQYEVLDRFALRD